MRKLKKDIWPHQITVILENSEEIDIWCDENIGHRFDDWYGYWNDGYSMSLTKVYAFRNTEALMLFKIRWSDRWAQFQDQ